MKKQVFIVAILLISMITICKSVLADDVKINMNKDDSQKLKITITSDDGKNIEAARLKLKLEEGVALNTDSDGKVDATVECNNGDLYELEINKNNNRFILNQKNPNVGCSEVNVIIGIKAVNNGSYDGIKIKWPEDNSEIIVGQKESNLKVEDSVLQVGNFKSENQNNGSNDNNGENNENPNNSDKNKTDEPNSGTENVNIDTSIINSGSLTTSDGARFGDKNTYIFIVSVAMFFISVILLIRNIKKNKK